MTASVDHLQWNDSLGADALWTSANLGEAVPDVMTPMTWSLIQLFMSQTMVGSSIGEHRLYGNIGGRFYMNLSFTKTLGDAFGQGKRVNAAMAQAFGLSPGATSVPAVPLSRWRTLRELTGASFRFLMELRRNQRRLPQFLAESPARSHRLREAIADAALGAELARLWATDVSTYFRECCGMLAAATRKDRDTLLNLRTELTDKVGDADAGVLTSGLHQGDRELASLGLLVGLQQLEQGAISRAEFADQYGHRGPHEFEVSWPRPAEDPGWIDAQLAGLRASDHGLQELLEAQDDARAAARERFAARFPREVVKTTARIEAWGMAARDREAARSELIRGFWVLRAFVVRAGVITGLGDDVFFVTLDEVLDALHTGSTAGIAPLVPGRRERYDRYGALPVYPVLIKGAFDPERWAADPHRRTDIFDPGDQKAAPRQTVRGFAGAAGVVDGRARVLDSPEQGAELEPGEILVTRVTNVGWTPLFPVAAGIVTDVGAPLSHAAIVARELGIPAVVGCGNATMVIRTGDVVRVDGGSGVVEILGS
jgi:phosphohistidine swiveling domain-containing protein